MFVWYRPYLSIDVNNPIIFFKWDNQSNLNIVSIFDDIKELWLIFGVWHIMVMLYSVLVKYTEICFNEMMAWICLMTTWERGWVNKQGHEIKGTREAFRFSTWCSKFSKIEKNDHQNPQGKQWNHKTEIKYKRNIKKGKFKEGLKPPVNKK